MAERPDEVNPYVGPQPFPPDRPLFGRDRELFALTNRVLADRLVLLYSPSGAGKTSLLQAKGGLRERLAGQELHPLPIARVNLHADAAARAGVNRYLLSLLVDWEQARPEADRRSIEKLAGLIRPAGDSPDALPLGFLSAHLAVLTPKDADGRPVQSILIFDQFEELLTLDPTDEPAKQQFLRQVGFALRDKDRWAVFAMREDHVPALDPFLPLLPTRLTATFRLDLLRQEAAKEAIQRPAVARGVDFEVGAVEQLVGQLSLTRVQNPIDGTTREKPGPFVEPVQLQVVCQTLWKQRRDPGRISLADLEALRLDAAEETDGVTAALGRHYDATVARVSRAEGVKERNVRRWFEQALISDTDLRMPVLLGTEGKFGLTREVLRQLADTYLIRVDRRLGGVWYELAHDRLVDPVRMSNKRWREHNLTEFQQKAELWDAAGRKLDRLVHGREINEAILYLRTIPEDPVDAAFLDSCLQERQRGWEQEPPRATDWLRILYERNEHIYRKLGGKWWNKHLIVDRDAATLSVEADGTLVGEQEISFRPGQNNNIQMILWELSSDEPLASLWDLDLALTATRANGDPQEVVVLPAGDLPNKKSFIFLFVPEVPATETVTYAFRWRWPQFWRPLLDTGCDSWVARIYSDQPIPEVSFRFRLAAEIHGRFPICRLENRGGGGGQQKPSQLDGGYTVYSWEARDVQPATKMEIVLSLSTS